MMLATGEPGSVSITLVLVRLAQSSPKGSCHDAASLLRG
jgi:hypothetical protein